MMDNIQPVLNRYLGSLQIRDWVTFESVLDDNFTYYTDGCIIQNREAFVGFMKTNDWQGEGYRIYDLSILGSEDQDLVVAVYKAEFKGSEGGQHLEFGATETTVLVKRDTGWKILHSHTSNKM